jgi:hypothetical protein
MFALVSDNVVASMFFDNFRKRELYRQWMIISPWTRNSCIWTFAKREKGKKKLLVSFDLNSGAARGTGLSAKSQLYIPVLLQTLSRDIRIEDCESWFATPFVLLRLNRIKTNWKFPGLRANRCSGAGRLWFSWNPLTSCSSANPPSDAFELDSKIDLMPSRHCYAVP